MRKEDEYRKDCIENDKDMKDVLLRNMKMLERTRTFLTPMKERLEEIINN
ncbi:MAG: hypothetical protein IJD58_09925 [Lachnospiraceae bacterium]|nr:hypothetical protein [Lachnospiraceae bacterium]